MPQPDWVFYVPMAKATVDDDGRIWVEGIASDESVDLENEIIKGSGLTDTIQLLETRGIFNWDHGKTPVGRITKAGLIDRAVAEKYFPEIKDQLGGVLVGDKAFYLKGWVDPPSEDEVPHEDLISTRHALKQGYPLGFSLQGGRVAQGQTQAPDGTVHPATERAFITKVAIAPFPINTHSYARIAKSLSEAVSCAEGGCDLPVVVVAKALIAGAGTEHADFGGGRAMTPESLHGALETTTWGCPKCGKETVGRVGTAPTCPECHVKMVAQKVTKAVDAHTAGGTSAAQDKGADKMARQKGRILKSLLSDLAAIFTKAAKIDDEEEGVEEEVEDVEEELSEVSELTQGEAEGEDEEPPTDEELEEMLAEPGTPELEEEGEEEEQRPPRKVRKAVDETAEGEQEEEEQEQEAEVEDDEEEVSKSVSEFLAEDEDLGPVIEAEPAFRAVLEEFDTRQQETAQDLMKAITTLAEGLTGRMDALEEHLGAREHEEGSKPQPGGYRPVTKGLPGGETPDLDPEEVSSKITKAVKARRISAEEATVLRKAVANGTDMALARAGAIFRKLDDDD